jgi:hypothetical protein
MKEDFNLDDVPDYCEQLKEYFYTFGLFVVPDGF